jgi:starch phosphorylase
VEIREVRGKNLMRTLGKVLVLPKVPQPLARLQELAHNLWWSWEPVAQLLFERLDADLWLATNHNPVKLLNYLDQERLDAAAADPDYLHTYQRVLQRFDDYMNPNNASAASSSGASSNATRFGGVFGSDPKRVIAYFSAEFGLHEALPIYSGGLGVLSGDHCKGASDLGLPFIGVGFLYPQGYFTQRIDAEGKQLAEYERLDFTEAPASPALDPNGREILISVDLPGRTVFAKVWRIQVGRVPVFLMDTNVERNAPQDRELSARLYYGDREMRISQEVVLGIGGVRAVHALGYEPVAWHMNEGHSAFLGLERVRKYVQENRLAFDEAVEVVRANTLFTTHTPVPAGNDAFSFELIDKFFWQYWGQLGLDRERFISFARQELAWGSVYSMTVLALRLSGFANGVSMLHGRVSREMWQFLWPDTPVAEVPIGYITNGVHTKTWLVAELQELYRRYLGAAWSSHVSEPSTWQAIEDIPDQELWSIHEQRKGRLIQFVRERLRAQAIRHGEGPQRVMAAANALKPGAFTIGFARRFATYKRATLIFRDKDRLKQILHNPERPVQIIFSGKAHPDDEPGKALIQQIYRYSLEPDFAGKIVFVENYDMNIARHLVSGVDLWLNTPRRPREASGTSGQKAAQSGIPSCSVLDGWWVEGYDDANGWAIGEERQYKDVDTQDDADADSLYRLLEQEIVPLFYNRDDDGVPYGWLAVMKQAIQTCAPRFSMERMLLEYSERYYLPAATTGQRYANDGYALARSVAGWKAAVRERWSGLHIDGKVEPTTMMRVGEPIRFEARIWLRGVSESDLAVEAVLGKQTGMRGDGADTVDGVDGELQVVELQPVGQQDGAVVYQGEFTPTASGRLLAGIRARAHHPGLVHPAETGLMRWA